jgi:hypothetical protein
MTLLPNGESHGGEPEPDPLGLGFAVFGVGDGGTTLGCRGGGCTRLVTAHEISHAPCQGFYRR